MERIRDLEKVKASEARNLLEEYAIHRVQVDLRKDSSEFEKLLPKLTGQTIARVFEMAYDEGELIEMPKLGVNRFLIVDVFKNNGKDLLLPLAIKLEQTNRAGYARATIVERLKERFKK